LRVELVKDYVKKNFPSSKMLDYALAVETVTTSKKDNLILNVDGCIAVCFVDLVRNCGAFTAEEAEDYLKMGVLNGLFVLGRSIGLIAHFLDQKRLRTGLYRHPWDDIVSFHDGYLDRLVANYRYRPTFSHPSPAVLPEERAVSRSACKSLRKENKMGWVWRYQVRLVVMVRALSFMGREFAMRLPILAFRYFARNINVAIDASH
jgi:hypothetical protein